MGLGFRYIGIGAPGGPPHGLLGRIVLLIGFVEEGGEEEDNLHAHTEPQDPHREEGRDGERVLGVHGKNRCRINHLGVTAFMLPAEKGALLWGTA